MASINISLTEEAYKYLKMLKGRDKSFSDIVLEFKDTKCYRKGSKENVLRFAGGLKDLNIDWKEKERRMKKFRELFNKRMEETTEYMHTK